MKITALDTYLVEPRLTDGPTVGGKNWLFVRLDSEDGLTGWGESYTQLDRDKAIELHIHELSRYVVGRSAFHIKAFLQMVYEDFATKRGSMDLYCAVSGIEQAMWDLVGKKLGVPVYDLLGGPCRDRIPVYANGWSGGSHSPQDYAARAKNVVDRGFRALKFDPFPGPWRLHVDRSVEQTAVANVQAVREAVGPDVEILVEVHRRLAPAHAIRVARALEPLAPYWFEEPVPSENLAALAEVRAATSIPVVTGEALYTKRDFREVFEKRAADIINPDVCNCGGILELKEIGAMAEPHYVAVSPHNFNSTTIGLAASVQVAALMPNFTILEYFVNYEEVGRAISDTPLVAQDGSIPLPQKPGLGVNLIPEELEARPYKKRAARALPF